jgi:hypothetical protein
MAITTNIRIEKSANKGIPTAYVPATLPTLTDKKNTTGNTQILCSAVEDADPNVALTNLETELQTYLTGVFYDAIMHFDTADTITVNIRVSKIERTRLVTNDLMPGLPVFDVDFLCEWSY